MIILEQIEALRQLATLYKPMQTSQLTIDHEVVKDLCTLAKRGLATRKRPIAEAPKDGRVVLLFDSEGRCRPGYFDKAHAGEPEMWRDWHGSDYDPTHFIPLSALEEE